MLGHKTSHDTIINNTKYALWLQWNETGISKKIWEIKKKKDKIYMEIKQYTLNDQWPMKKAQGKLENTLR